MEPAWCSLTELLLAVPSVPGGFHGWCSWGHFWGTGSHHVHSLIAAYSVYKSTFSSDQGLSRRAPKCLSLPKPLSEQDSIFGGRILPQLSFS